MEVVEKKKCGCLCKEFVVFVIEIVIVELGELVVKRGRGWFKGLINKKGVVLKFMGLKWFCGCFKGLIKKKFDEDKVVFFKKLLNKFSE